MAPPTGGSAATAAAASDSSAEPDPFPAAVLLSVHAAVRPLDAGPEAEAPLRRLQLVADPERPGCFRLRLRGAGPEAVSATAGARGSGQEAWSAAAAVPGGVLVQRGLR